MKNFTIVVLAVLLVAAIILGSILFVKYRGMEDTLRASNKELLGLNEKVAELNKERSKLYDQIKKNAERLKRLESPELRISQLEDAIKAKDQALSGIDEKISKLEETSKEEKKIRESLRKELSSMDGMVAGLKEKLQEQTTSPTEGNPKHAEKITEFLSMYNLDELKGLLSHIRTGLKNQEKPKSPVHKSTT